MVRPGRVARGVLSLLLLPAAAPAQTILNTERFQLDEVDGPHLSADVSLSFQGGNARVLDASASGMVGTLSGSNWVRAIFGGRYLSTRESSVLDAEFLQLRYSRVLSPATRTFHFLQTQRNRTLLLRSRWLAGTGVRTDVARSRRGTLALGSGVMGEREVLDPDRLGREEEERTGAVRLANLAVLSWVADSGLRILNILYVQPDLSAFGDIRILNDFALTAPLGTGISSSLSLEWRHDTRPPGTLGRDDLRLAAGLALAFP